jgi:hypothetical protein
MSFKKFVFGLVFLGFFSVQNAKCQIVNQGMDDDIRLAVNEGDLMITGFVSFPNWGRYSAELVLSSSSASNYSSGGYAPLGLQFEYMLANNFGFTFDGIFNKWEAKWESDGFDNQGNAQTFENTVSVNRMRFLVGLNYHLDDLKNERLNLYGGFGVGFNDRRLRVNVDENSWGNEFWGPAIDIPLAVRARMGMRFFVSEAIGLNLELGAGGPVLRFGLTFKFPT